MIEMQNSANYAFEGGMKNIAYITGYARKVTDAEGVKRYYIQQHNDTSRMVPVEAGKNGLVQRHFQDRLETKVYGRIRGRVIEHQGEKIHDAYVIPIGITRPSILEMPEQQVWHAGVFNRDRSKVEQDDFQPFGSSEGSRKARGRGAANTVLLSGIVNKVSALTNGEGLLSGVEIELRQHKNLDTVIPVRMMKASIAGSMQRNLRMGMPVYIVGALRMRDLKETSPDGVISNSGKRVGYVWCPNILRAIEGADILALPTWVNAILERYGLMHPSVEEPSAEVRAADEAEAAFDPEDARTEEEALRAAGLLV
ncbi:MAG: hypothetical protein M1492_08095 [Gammaproteobacteria bacterium]|jgi:hypothetical protein|uniref:hypothetical protein n=1 Tax=Acidithiobacillus ferrooxidans TaxID=920 RepID=UPI00214880F8|nr:hypothetical protein [Acidithiobacillus ferrooxidans]MCL4526440.1 hypothetical protein [Gammaproteobacteria bacterium]MCR1345308.1 hypothetical protein [Acidithiobacillus ferrooxidans]MCR1354468.1 hypothetical protein [Acidithiobacillus ferrooxidans]